MNDNSDIDTSIGSASQKEGKGLCYANQVRKAIHHLPQDVTAAYFEAVERCPSLLQSESDYAMFMLSEDCNVISAALKVALHWTKRKSIFGDRCHNPLLVSSLTTTNDLHTDDLAILRSGFILPMPKKDCSGRRVLLVDITRRSMNYQSTNVTDAELRCLYYLMAAMLADEFGDGDEKRGIVTLAAVVVVPTGISQSKTTDIQAQIIRHVEQLMPVKLVSVNVLLQLKTSPGQAPCSLPECRHLPSRKTTFIPINSIEDAAEKLGGLGVDKNAIPTSLGGTWDWRQYVALLEQGRSTQHKQDVHVNDILSMETQSLRETALARLQEAISLLPDDEKVGYLNAAKHSPHIVSRESDPIRFLRHARYDTTAAARRLAAYWTKRLRVFGTTSAFRAFDLSEDGALTEREIKILRSGFMTLLRPDSSGRPVLYLNMTDESRSVLCGGQDVTMRALFFLLTLMLSSSGGVPQKEGCICLCSVQMSQQDQTCIFSNEMKREIEDVVSNAIPVDLKTIHLVTMSQSNDAPDSMQLFMPFALKSMGTLVSKYAVFHNHSNGQEVVEKLSLHGFRGVDLPKAMGGQLEDPTRGLVRILDESGFVDSKPSASRQGVARREATPLTDAGLLFGESQLNAQEARQSLISASHPESEEGLLSRLHKLHGPLLELLPTAPPNASEVLENHLRMQKLLATRNGVGSGQDLAGALGVGRTQTFPAPLFRQGVGGILDSLQMGVPTAATAGLAPASLLLNQNTQCLPQAKTADDEYSRRGIRTNHNSCAEPSAESKLIRQTGLLALNEALKLMPLEEKSAYLEAVRRIPHLFEVESDPFRFLRCENFVATAAARRLVTYWNVRKELFGERAFLPMTQTGEGALTRDDVVVLSSASYSILPKDGSNRSVFCADRSRIIEDRDGASQARLRCFFYLLSVLAEDEMNQKEGYVALFILVMPRVSEFDEDYVRKCFCISERVIPIRLKAMHVLVCPPKSGRKAVTERIISSGLAVVHDYFSDRALVHIGESPQALFKKLRVFGLEEESLPSSLGGTWKYGEFAQWQRQRCRSEQGLETTFDDPADNQEQPNRKLTESERKERKRKLNVIHSRQKRERRRAEMEELQEERNELEAENTRLRNENKKLASLLTCAESMIPADEQDPSTAAEGAANAQVRRPEAKNVTEAATKPSHNEQQMSDPTPQGGESLVDHLLARERELILERVRAASGSAASPSAAALEVLRAQSNPPALNNLAQAREPVSDVVASLLGQSSLSRGINSISRGAAAGALDESWRSNPSERPWWWQG